MKTAIIITLFITLPLTCFVDAECLVTLHI